MATFISSKRVSGSWRGCGVDRAQLEFLTTRVPTAVGELTVGELIFSHSYNFFFGREFALGATIGAMAKFAHVTNRHKISYKLNV